MEAPHASLLTSATRKKGRQPEGCAALHRLDDCQDPTTSAVANKVRGPSPRSRAKLVARPRSSKSGGERGQKEAKTGFLPSSRARPTRPRAHCIANRLVRRGPSRLSVRRRWFYLRSAGFRPTDGDAVGRGRDECSRPVRIPVTLRVRLERTKTKHLRVVWSVIRANGRRESG